MIFAMQLLETDIALRLVCAALTSAVQHAELCSLTQGHIKTWL